MGAKRKAKKQFKVEKEVAILRAKEDARVNARVRRAEQVEAYRQKRAGMTPDQRRNSNLLWGIGAAAIVIFLFVAANSSDESSTQISRSPTVRVTTPRVTTSSVSVAASQDTPGTTAQLNPVGSAEAGRPEVYASIRAASSCDELWVFYEQAKANKALFARGDWQHDVSESYRAYASDYLDKLDC